MGFMDQFGALLSGLVAAIVMLVFAILSLFVLVFIVDVAASIGGLDPSDDIVVLGASLIAAAAIIAGGAGIATGDSSGSGPPVVE